MGRFADRLARRQHPLYVRARSLVRMAVDDLHDADADPEARLDYVLRTFFDELKTDELELLVTFMQEETQLYEDAEDIAEHLHEAARRLATTLSFDDADIDAPGYLFSMPLQVRASQDLTSADSWDADLCELLAEKLHQAELVEDEAIVTLLPMLVSAELVDRMDLGDVYQLTRMLARGADQEAAEFIKQLESPQERAQRDSRWAHEGAETLQTLVLVGFAESEAESPFVVAKLCELEHAALPDSADAGHHTAHAALHDDITSHLTAVSEAIQDALGVEFLDILVPADYWYDNHDVGFMAQREQVAKQQLQVMALEHCGGDLTRLHIHNQADMSSDGLTVGVHRKDDDVLVGTLHWRDARYESWPEALRQLVHLLLVLGVHPHIEIPGEPSEQPRGPLH